MKQPWFKESVVYQVYPRSFRDSNGDGIGDLRGIASKLDYLKALGVDVARLSPVYQSPNDDNGYDISDYRNIMAEFGTLADFDALLDAMHARGMEPAQVMAAIHAKSRDNARTPMQWNGGPYAGFSTGTQWIGVNPDHREVNAQQAMADPDSVFHHYRWLIELRRTLPVNLAFEGQELQIANYPVEAGENLHGFTLRSYEARAYRLR